MIEHEDVTALIERAGRGEKDAADRLFATVYAQLHRIAGHVLRSGRSDDAMHTTSLVHDAYLKLRRPEALNQHDREHFFAVAARAMRQIVIDHARERAAQKRGGEFDLSSLDSSAIQVAASGRSEHLLALDESLERLAAVDPELARLVELRFFGGLDLAELSRLQGRSERSLKRDWRRARAFLLAGIET
ncbi:MAG: ECF-type sigma factor [Lysobacterales bacterium]